MSLDIIAIAFIEKVISTHDNTPGTGGGLSHVFKRQIMVQATAMGTQTCMHNLKLSFANKIIFRDFILS